MSDFFHLEERPYLGATVKVIKKIKNWSVTIIPPVAPSKKKLK